MEESTPMAPHRAVFTGQGSQLFAIQIVNFFLCIVTLGLYYPWARVNVLKYMYQETEFAGKHFTFHGTGKEYFIGFIKAVGIIIALGLLSAVSEVLAVIGFYALLPIALHGSLKYRMSRTTWNGIQFGYRGELGEFMKKFFIGLFLTVITLGIYGAWWVMDMERYLRGNMRAGSAQFKFEGEGADYFWLNIKGYFLTIITFGIYSFWWFKDLFNYLVDNSSVELNGQTYYFKGYADPGSYFRLVAGNVLLIFFTLGIGTSWAIVRSMRYTLEHLDLDGAFDPSLIENTEAEYNDATGDALGDALGIM